MHTDEGNHETYNDLFDKKQSCNVASGQIIHVVSCFHATSKTIQVFNQWVHEEIAVKNKQAKNDG